MTFPELFALNARGDGFLAAWYYEDDTDKEFIHTRRLDAEGLPVGPVLKSAAPLLADLRMVDGQFIVTARWDNDDIVLRRLDASGAITGGGVVDSDGSGPDGRPQADGSVLVGFTGLDSEGRSVGAFVRRVEAGGAIGPRVPISGAGRVSLGGVALAPVAGGSGAQAIWAETGANGLAEVWARRLSGTGSPVGAPVQLSFSEPSIAPDDPYEDDLDGATRLAIAFEPSLGQYLVTWAVDDAAVGSPRILGRRLDAAGAPIDAQPLLISSQNPTSIGIEVARAPEVVSDPTTGAWLVTRLPAWRPGSNWDYESVLVRRLPYADPASGLPEVRVDDPSSGVGPPAIAVGPSGPLVAWNPMKWTRRGPVSRRLGLGPDPGVARFTSAPSGDVASRDASFTVASSRPGATLECRFDGGLWGPCGSLHDLPDGVHRYGVHSVGPEGWVELGDGAEVVWRTEAAPPETTITEFPKPNTKFARTSFIADEKSTFECRWDRGTWYACTPEERPGTSLADGPHVFEVRATDDVGRREPVPARYEWTIDTKAPETTVLTGPIGVSADEWGVLTFASDEPAATFECAAGGGAWVPCRSGEPARSHLGWINVRARDAAGNVDATPVEWRWDYRPLPPVVSLRAYDGQLAGVARVNVDYEAGDTVECRVDEGPWQRCLWRLEVFDLAPGQHRVQARGIDDLGRVGPVAEVWTEVWGPEIGDLALRVESVARDDDAAPDTVVTSGPPPRTTSTSASFSFTSNDPGARFECSWWNNEWVSCTSPRTYANLGEGLQEVRIRAVAADGTPDPTPVIWRWSVNALPPDTVLTGLPETRSEQAYFSWRVSETDEIASAECRLDGGDWFTCARPARLTVAYGQHHIEIRTIDVDGVRDPDAGRA